MIGHLNRMLYGMPTAGVPVGERNRWPLVPLGACVLGLVVLGLTLPGAGRGLAVADCGDCRPMTRLDQLANALDRHAIRRVADMRVVRTNELHCSVDAATVPMLAGMLRVEFGAELAFMAASDRRADRGVFEVHYLFRPEREVWSLHATAAASADRAGDSLAGDVPLSGLAVRARDVRPVRNQGGRASGSQTARAPRILAGGLLPAAAGRRAA